MFLLAEIADKMPTLAFLWQSHFIFAVVLAGFATSHRWIAFGMLIVSSLAPISACHEGFFDGYFTQCIWSELGRDWVVSSVASSMMPPLFVLVVIVGQWRFATLHQQSKTIARTSVEACS